MSSSISSSRREFKTCLAVVAVLVLLDVFVARYQNWLSGDVIHLSKLPEIAQSIRGATGGKILFLGNSLTREGVSLPVIREQFAGGPLGGLTWQKVHPDDTNIIDWYYLYKHWFIRTGSTPDVLVVGFARNYLSDASAMHPDEIATNFGGLRNIPEIFHEEITDSSSRVNYVLASTSSLFANRRRISLRLADIFIPDYRATAEYFNQFVRFNRAQSASSTYRQLLRFNELCRQQNTLLITVAMPIANDYEIDSELLKTLSDAGIVFIDLRRVNGLENAQYADLLHLNSAGAAIYSRALAHALHDQAHLTSVVGKRDRLAASGN